MSHVGAVRVPVLVDKPFPLAGVGMSRADVLGLQMLQLTVDVVPVRHPWQCGASSNSEIGSRGNKTIQKWRLAADDSDSLHESC